MTGFSIHEALQSQVYFRGINPQTLTYLAEQASLRALAQGEMILLEGEMDGGLWIIVQGRVKIYKMSAEGVEHIMMILGEANTFNDIPVFDGQPTPANAAALSDVIAWVVPQIAFQTALERDTKLAVNVIHNLSARVRGLIRRMEDLTLHSVIVRLARFLLLQAENANLSGPGVTRAAIAAHLATTPQTISTLLRELESTGAIRFNRHEIIIMNENLLKSIALL
jgi:CRP/FNR family transcriptional regulator, dissimilatory nitrate respiration regulator